MAILKVNLDATGSKNGDSWNNAYTNLQSAIDAAKAEDEIWVAKGTYKPGDNRTNSFELKDDVNIYGGFMGTETTLEQRDSKNNVTILSGDIGTENDNSDNSYTVVKFTNKTGTATLDGFTIQDGNSNDDGGGVYNDGNLILKNVVVRNNQAADDGGGIRNNGELTIIDSTIADNTSVGTSDTSGGGGLINTGTSATIINSTFSSNEANNGGAIRNDTTLTLINSTLSGNTASTNGGGLVNTINPDNFSNPAQVTITNSTITDNTAENTSGNDDSSQVGGGIANFGNATVSNSIIAGNTDNDDFADVLFAANNTSNGNNIIGNGDGVSGFTDETNDDMVGTKANPIDPLLDTLKDNGGATQTHALLSSSPAINAGNDGSIPDDTADLDGDGQRNDKIPFDQRGKGFERVVDDKVDIGGFEFTATSTGNEQIDDTDALPAIEDTDAPPPPGGMVVLDEQFDDDSQFAKSTEFFSDGENDYFGISNAAGGGNFGSTDGTSPTGIKAYKGFTDNFLTGQDLDGEGASLPITLTWSNLNITGLTNLQFRGDFAEFFDSPGDIDTEDSIKVYYSIDGGQKQNLLWFSGENINTVYRQDADFDGVGDGTALSDAAQTFTTAIAGTGSTLDLELEVSVSSGDEDFAIDNFQITGEPIATPGVTVTQSNDTTNVTEGGATDSYSVVLDSQPSAEVIVNISTGSETTTDVSILSFTTDNWDTLQTVTVTAVDDSKVEGEEHTDTITHTVSSNDTDYNSITPGSITVNIIDNDVEDNNSTPDQEPDSPPISNPDQQPGSPPPTSTPDQEPDSPPTSNPIVDTANPTNSIRTVIEDGNEMEIIDLTGLAGQTVTATYEISRDADFDNNIYFYTVDDDNGNIDGLTPDADGYLEAALGNVINQNDGLNAADGAQGETGSFNLTGGNILGIAIIADGTLEQAISNLDSVEGVYLSYMGAGASTDNGSFDHIRFNSTTSTFEFEDLANGGDQDFNDITIKMDFTV